uniref:DRBM domain-containing protein n=1 Tax=Pavo cristatus TaxID=9049 RepID=A0A8C9FW16_PAVCR
IEFSYKLLSQTGPVHAPMFVMAVEVNGQLFEGSGPTKKKAKLHAAEKALRSFFKSGLMFQVVLLSDTIIFTRAENHDLLQSETVDVSRAES